MFQLHKKLKNWFRYDGRKSEVVAESAYDHELGAMTTFNNEPVVIGNNDLTKIEVYKDNKWYYVGMFPFASKNVYQHATVVLQDKLYVFGIDQE